MGWRRGVLVFLVPALVISAPQSVLADDHDACSWDASTLVLTVREDSESLQLPDPRFTLPCYGSSADAGLPPAGTPQAFTVQFTGVQRKRIVRVSPPRYAGVSIAVEPIPEGASGSLSFELYYDDAQEAPYYLKPFAAREGGIDLDMDGDLDIVVPAGQKYTLDVRSARHDISPIDLRQLPAKVDQEVRVELGIQKHKNINRIWGPQSGAYLVYRGGEGVDIVDSYGGDDAIHVGSGTNLVRSRDGDDWIGGHAGNDTVYAGAGDDHAWMGGGNNRIYLGAGTNHAVGGRGRGVIRGGPGRDFVQDSGVVDIKTFGGDDEVDVMGSSRGIIDCGAGRDWRHHLYVDERSVSCERFARKRQTYPPVQFNWTEMKHAYLCRSGWFYRAFCVDPRG